MRQQMWSLAVAALAFGSLALVGGTAIGDELGPLVVAYGLLIAVAALYLVAGLAIRERVRHRAASSAVTPATDRLAGRRVF